MMSNGDQNENRNKRQLLVVVVMIVVIVFAGVVAIRSLTRSSGLAEEISDVMPNTPTQIPQVSPLGRPMDLQQQSNQPQPGQAGAQPAAQPGNQ